MICYASLALFVYNILKLLTYHTLFYWQPSLIRFLAHPV